MDENISGEDDQGGVMEALSKDKSEELLEIIRRRMKESSDDKSISVDNISIADEIEKLSTLRKKGVLSESEFQKMKQQLSEKM
jgi:hypothetical protein